MGEVTIEDRILIRELYDRCYWALNTADGDGVLACFVPGGHVEQYNGNIVTAEQSAAGAVARQEDPVGKTWQHHVTNFIVEPDPEGNESRRAVKLYFLITLVEEPPEVKVRWSCFGNDTVEKVDGEWKIVRRKINLNDVRTA